MEAARHWARGPVGDPENVANALAAAGAPVEVIDAARASETAEQDFEVFEENMETVHVFLALSTQWRAVGGMGGIALLGIEYSSIPPVLDLMEIPRERHAETFVGIRVMEAAALPVRNARKGEEPAPLDD